ncbi:MAG: transposase [Akkermansiaceae bacterium]
MARPLRYEASGAVYHVMARGDGGKTVFEDDKDHFAWVDLLERACARFGWRVHAWVLMGNHFHFLVETPEPNLVPGMKWMLGVYSQGWNRRRERHGHVFQGRYKAVVVNGEERGGTYFKIVADYIHLNPARSRWVGGNSGKSLKSWRWSSFPAYAGGKKPDWLETGRVLRAFQLSEDRRGGRAYGGYLEARAKDMDSAVNDASLAELRRGWYLGEKGFGEKVLEAVAEAVRPKRRKGSLGGEAAKAHDHAEAENIAKGGLAALGLPDVADDLRGRGKWIREKAAIAAVIRKRTGVGNLWISGRLEMGHEGSVTRAVRWVREDKEGAKLGKALEKMLNYRD